MRAPRRKKEIGTWSSHCTSCDDAGRSPERTITSRLPAESSARPPAYTGSLSLAVLRLLFGLEHPRSENAYTTGVLGIACPLGKKR